MIRINLLGTTKPKTAPGSNGGTDNGDRQCWITDRQSAGGDCT